MTRLSRSFTMVALVAALVALAGASTFLAVAAQSPKPASAAKAGPIFDAYAVRYATAPDVPVSSLVAGADKSRKIDIPFMVWALKGAGGRNLLVDAGSYQGPVFERWKLRDVVKPSLALARIGISPDEVSDIIVTHIHWDHIGGVDLFPRARVWIQRDEFTHYVDAQGRPKDAAITADDARMLARLNKDGRLSLVDGDAKEILPGITVYIGGKHTYATQYVGVHTAAGTVIIASDSIYLYENLDKHLPLGLTADQAADLRVQERVLQLASSPRLVVPGHDPAVFERFPKPGNGIAKIE